MNGHIYARTSNGLVVGQLAGGGRGVQIFPVDKNFRESEGARSYAMRVGKLLDTYAGSTFWSFRCTGCHRLIAGNHEYASQVFGRHVIEWPRGQLLCSEVEVIDDTRGLAVDTRGYEEYFDGVCYVKGHDCLAHLRSCQTRGARPCNGLHRGLARGVDCLKCQGDLENLGQEESLPSTVSSIDSIERLGQIFARFNLSE